MKPDLKRLREKISLLKSAKKNQKQLSLWITNVKGLTGYSQPKISSYLNENYAPDTNFEISLCAYIDEFLSIEDPIQTIKGTTNASIDKVLKTHYLAKVFYLYSFDRKFIKSKKENIIIRSVLRIGDSVNNIVIANSQKEFSNYHGSFYMNHHSRHLIFRMVTTDTNEKELTIIFRTPIGNPIKYLIGGCLNIEKNGGVVMGSIVAEIQENKDELKPAMILPDSTEYESLNPHIKRYLLNKENNFIKIPSKPISTDDDFTEFFALQDRKKKP